ncbi:hypothetical protein [Prevotella jejuni]
MAQAVLKDTMVNISKTTGDGCWRLGVELKDIMFNTYKTVGDGCWRLGIELKDIMFNTLKPALLQLFRPPSFFHSYVSEYSNSVSSANFFHEKKYFSS